jgi:nitrate reductase gamma subunit
MFILYLFTYFAILVFVILVIAKVIKYASTPIHLRWELYPVAHEPKRNKYGGSYYEETNWWQKKLKKDHISELWAMFEEIIFLKGVFHHNRKIWFFSFPFHFGLYLIIASLFFIVLSVILDLLSIINLLSLETTLEYILHTLINITGYVGLLLTFLGAFGLLIQRITDERFKVYNTPMEFINLIFIIVLTLSVAVTFMNSNDSFIASKIFVKNLITANIQEIGDLSFVFHIVLMSLFFLYFPITRMMHLVAKYFLYHDVRWDDAPNLKGGKMEKRIKKALNFGVSWSAPHMKSGKTWAEVATNLPEEMKK